jgi:sphingosine-1-phosphate phosphatase 1
MPRPGPPVVRLEKKWELEYGMPSTHAVVGAAVPFATIIFTASRYQYPIELGFVGAFAWCSLVCMSRLYLGMHSVLDIIAGLSLVGVLFVPVIPLVDYLDPIILQSEFGGIGLFLVGVFLCFCTPGGDRWTPARYKI